MNLFFKYKQDAVMNINRCCPEAEQDFRKVMLING